MSSCLLACSSFLFAASCVVKMSSPFFTSDLLSSSRFLFSTFVYVTPICFRISYFLYFFFLLTFSLNIRLHSSLNLLFSPICLSLFVFPLLPICPSIFFPSVNSCRTLYFLFSHTAFLVSIICIHTFSSFLSLHFNFLPFLLCQILNSLLSLQIPSCFFLCRSSLFSCWSY